MLDKPLVFFKVFTSLTQGRGFFGSSVTIGLNALEAVIVGPSCTNNHDNQSFYTIKLEWPSIIAGRLAVRNCRRTRGLQPRRAPPHIRRHPAVPLVIPALGPDGTRYRRLRPARGPADAGSGESRARRPVPHASAGPRSAAFLTLTLVCTSTVMANHSAGRNARHLLRTPASA